MFNETYQDMVSGRTSLETLQAGTAEAAKTLQVVKKQALKIIRPAAVEWIEETAKPMKKDLRQYASDFRRVVKGKKVSVVKAMEMLEAVRQARSDFNYGRSRVRDKKKTLMHYNHWCDKGHAFRNAEQLKKALHMQRRIELEHWFDVFKNGSLKVVWTSALSDCKVLVDYEMDSNGYSSRCDFSMKVWSVAVHAQQLMRSELPGERREIDGLITLGANQADAELAEQVGADRVWRVRWARKRKGIEWTVHDGFIAQIGEVLSHGNTPQQAAANCKRRITVDRHNQEDILIRKAIKQGDSLERTFTAEELNCPIDLRLARRAGMCKDGVIAWAEDHFPKLSPMTDTITVADALPYADDDLVKTVCLFAVRKYRNQLNESQLMGS